MDEPGLPEIETTPCPACGHAKLWVSGRNDERRVCDRCGRCWDPTATPWIEIDTLACDGCRHRFICSSRPTTAIVRTAKRVSSSDGTLLLIRPLVAGDRSELAREYDDLSSLSRHRRFFSPPNRLSESMLDYLTDLDLHDRLALIAYPLEQASPRGVGIARFVRDRIDVTSAEAAIVVVDDWQGRGVGTQLLIDLIDRARAEGIDTFTADVLWENEPVLTPLRALGARIHHREPGVAQVAFDLPEPGQELVGTAVRAFFSSVAASADTADEQAT